ncbi:MAG: hypothetical protein U5O39_13895 [Gammaproteobacteria bacterium]|nr:hypothetical protein [Gammaproteobacteria bacterium]
MIETGPQSDEPLVPSQRRLQRPPDFTGSRLDAFAQVSLRHGFPGAISGALCPLHPDMRSSLASGLALSAADPARYFGIGLALLVAMICWSAIIERRLDARAVGWIIWLFLVSAWEEMDLPPRVALLC